MKLPCLTCIGWATGRRAMASPLLAFVLQSIRVGLLPSARLPQHVLYRLWMFGDDRQQYARRRVRA